MSVIWKLNGTSVGTLDVARLVLRLVNQGADVLTFEHLTRFDTSSLLFAPGDAVVLTRHVGGSASTWFRGRVRSMPRSAEAGGESVAYEVLGGWDLLERRAYLQAFAEPDEPFEPESTLSAVLRGRVVLSQSAAGAKVSLAAALTDVVDFAIASGAPLAVGTINVGALTVPWDEVTDLSCAEVVQRLLQWAPDAVCWFDYSVDPPAFNCVRRATGTLGSQSFLIRPAVDPDENEPYTPFDSISLRPRYDLLVSNVVLIYIATNTENSSAWETTSRDVWPGGSTGREDGALVRTIQLAGSVYNSTVLEQRVKAAVIPSVVRSGYSTPITSGGDFATLSWWWTKHAPELASSNVTIKSFKRGGLTRIAPTPPDEAPAVQPTYELLDGAVTDWMRERAGVEVEAQTITADVEIEVADPNDATKVHRLLHPVTVTVTAINSDRSLYQFLESDSFQPAEAKPTGLAAALHAALSALQYDGRFEIVQDECERWAAPGDVVSLDGGPTAWETMGALVQQTEFHIDHGRTVVTVGPAKHLGPDDLVELYRSNRTRQAVTSHMVRIGGTRASGTRQGLGIFQPRANSSALPSAPRVFTGSITIATSPPIPTTAEITTALQNVFGSGGDGADTTPRGGDTVNLFVSGALKFRASVTITNPGSTGTVFSAAFTIASVTYYAELTQVGLF